MSRVPLSGSRIKLPCRVSGRMVRQLSHRWQAVQTPLCNTMRLRNDIDGPQSSTKFGYPIRLISDSLVSIRIFVSQSPPVLRSPSSNDDITHSRHRSSKTARRPQPRTQVVVLKRTAHFRSDRGLRQSGDISMLLSELNQDME